MKLSTSEVKHETSINLLCLHWGFVHLLNLIIKCNQPRHFREVSPILSCTKKAVNRDTHTHKTLRVKDSTIWPLWLHKLVKKILHNALKKYLYKIVVLIFLGSRDKWWTIKHQQRTRVLRSSITEEQDYSEDHVVRRFLFLNVECWSVPTTRE